MKWRRVRMGGCGRFRVAIINGERVRESGSGEGKVEV